MIRLDLPDCGIKVGGTPERPTVFCPLRQRYVALTPEEWVRQHFVGYLTGVLGYPAALLANEVTLRVGGKRLRADTVLYDAAMRPRMIIEYKAPTVAVTQRAFDQILAYNTLLHAPYLAVSNGLRHFCCRLREDGRSYTFLPGVPGYGAL